MAETGTWLWLLEWQLCRPYINRWKRLPKGTKVRLVSTKGLETLYAAFISDLRPVSYAFNNSDILTEEGSLRPDLQPNDQYTVVPEACFLQVLQPYVSQALEAWIAWEAVLQPCVFLPLDQILVLHCLEKETIKVEVPLQYPNYTIRELLSVLNGQENPQQISWWTYCDKLDKRIEKWELCCWNRRLKPIIPSEKSVFSVLNSPTIMAEHRTRTILDLQSETKLGIGLTNLGKTCFLNAVLQCLLHIPSFLQYFLHECAFSDVTSLTSLLQQLIKIAYFHEDRVEWMPEAIFEKLCEVRRYEKSTREDANEVFLVLLDILQSEIPPREEVPVVVCDRLEISSWLGLVQREPVLKSELFGGLQKQMVTCCVCQNSQSHVLPFCSLSLDLPPQRSFSISFVYFDPSQPQRLLQLESDTPLEENAIINSVRELVISTTQNPNLLVGQNRNQLLEARMGLSNMITSSSFIALELPTLNEDLRLILVDFYSASGPLCSRVLSVHRAVSLVDVISDVIYYLVQVEEAVKETQSVAGYMAWLSRSSNEATTRQYRESGKLVFVAQDEGVINLDELRSNGVETVGDLCLNLGDKMPRFKFTSGNFSYGAKAYLAPLESSFAKFQGYFFSSTDSGLTATLLQLLEFTLRDKPLNEEDLLLCPQCKHPTQHIVRLQILRFPRILPIVFQRVRILPTQLIKSLIQIQYPVEGLDLREMEKGVGYDPAVYDLKAVIQHTGGSLSKGHYVASAEDPVSLQWVHFNDSGVTLGRAQVEDAYMLFYTRRLD